MVNGSRRKRAHKDKGTCTHSVDMQIQRATEKHTEGSEDSTDEDEHTLTFTESRTINKDKEGDSENDIDAVDASFDLCDPSEEDFHGVRTFIANTLILKDCQISEITDCICEQGNIGGLWKDDENKVFGVLSILNTKQHTCVDAVVQRILRLARKHDKTNDESAWTARLEPPSDAHTGILINERIVNFPEALVPIQFNSLQEDVKWSQTTPECPKDEQQYYFFNDYIMIGKCYEDCAQHPSPLKRQNSKKGSRATENSQKLLFPKFEEQFILSESDISFLAPTGKHVRIASTQDSKASCSLLPEFIAVCAINANKLNKIICNIKTVAPKDPSLRISDP